MLLKTYVFCLRHSDERTGVHPVLCRTNAEALQTARDWLDRHADCESIDVLLGETEIFSVARP